MIRVIDAAPRSATPPSVTVQHPEIVRCPSPAQRRSGQPHSDRDRAAPPSRAGRRQCCQITTEHGDDVEVPDREAQPVDETEGRLRAVREVVDQHAQVSRIVHRLVEQHRTPEHDADHRGHDGPTPADHGDEHQGRVETPNGERGVGDVPLGAIARRSDQGNHHPGVAAEDGPGGEEHDHPRSKGRCGFHGWVSETWPNMWTATTMPVPIANTPNDLPRRYPIHSAPPMAADWIRALPTSSDQ